MDFINAVHLRRELWDVEESSFRNRVAKKDGWQAVGEEFGISGVEASKKFKNLRTYAQNERKKQKSGSGASKKKPWFAFEAIQFVLARDIPNAGVDSENRTTVSNKCVYLPILTVYSFARKVFQSNYILKMLYFVETLYTNFLFELLFPLTPIMFKFAMILEGYSGSLWRWFQVVKN